jgi:hypothetical protein
LEPSFHGLPFVTSTLLSGRTLIVTKIFSILSKHDRVGEEVG